MAVRRILGSRRANRVCSVIMVVRDRQIIILDHRGHRHHLHSLRAIKHSEAHRAGHLHNCHHHSNNGTVRPLWRARFRWCSVSRTKWQPCADRGRRWTRIRWCAIMVSSHRAHTARGQWRHAPHPGDVRASSASIISKSAAASVSCAPVLAADACALLCSQPSLRSCSF